MTEEQLKQMLTEETNASAPDKEALWAKIDSQLKPKTAPAKRSSVPKFVKITGFAAACAAAALFVPMIFNLVNLVNGSSAMTNKPDNSASQSYSSSYQSDNSPSFSSDSSPVGELPNAELLRYDELAFPSYSQTLLKCSGEPFGDEYFVEQDILAKTDVIVRARVNKVYYTDDKSGICYDVAVADAFSEAEISSSLTVVSRSPYPMRRGRDYLLLLTEDKNGYHTVFDNVPQTEYTADGGMVYFNGWQSLKTDSSRALVYSEQPDAFFYDRMMYSTSVSTSQLIDAWSEIRSLHQI